MNLYKTTSGIYVSNNDEFFLLEEDWDQLVNRDELFSYLKDCILGKTAIEDKSWQNSILAPIGNQEVWAAGVTYLRSRDARMEESKNAGGADFYSMVYNAERPELFFKALPHRVVGPNKKVFIRKDSKWNVPEPELTLFINSKGNIQGYTIGNDMSSRDIEGENPLYLPQAKVYNNSAALGPSLFVPEHPISLETEIKIMIRRNAATIFENAIQLNKMKRNFTELVEYLFREYDFEKGAYLMTGTGMIPPNDFTLMIGDEISITVDDIGTLTNSVAERSTP
ncbi:MAG: fumarylacetoacetate hydrolase family protein [Ginsengibacter sp.]